MKNHQDLVLEELAKIAKKYKLTILKESSFLNTPTIYFKREFKTILKIDFDFQSNYFTTKDSYIKYDNEKDLISFFEKIKLSLK